MKIEIKDLCPSCATMLSKDINKLDIGSAEVSVEDDSAIYTTYQCAICCEDVTYVKESEQQ